MKSKDKETVAAEYYRRGPGGYVPIPDDEDDDYPPQRRGRGGYPGGGYPDGGRGGHPLKSSRPQVKLESSLKETFNDVVQEALQNHPRALAGRFVFINIPEKQVIQDVSPDKTRFRTQEQVDSFVNSVSSQIVQSGSSAAALFEPRLGIKALAFTPLPFRLFTTKDQPYEMEALATVYHELGHLIAPNAMGAQQPALAENVADIYGIFRHLQKYGDESKAIEVGSWSRAFRFVLTGQGDHFTTLSIDALPKLLEKLDVNALTPDQTANLASRIALQYTPNVDVMKNVAGSFQNVLPTIMRKRSFEAGLKEIADVTLASDQAYFTFRIGSSALKRFLDGKVNFDVETQTQLFGEQVSDYTGPIKLEGEYWDGVRQKMKERSEQLEREGVLLGMPHKGQPQKPASDKPANGNGGWSLNRFLGAGVA